MSDSDLVLLQPLQPWSAGAVLGAHMGTVDYQLATARIKTNKKRTQRKKLPRPIAYDSNERVWQDIIAARLTYGSRVTLRQFQLVDWFPRSPGLYYAPGAAGLRQEAMGHLDPSFGAPRYLNPQGGAIARMTPASAHTIIFDPYGKASMLQGGIGAIRLRPIRLFAAERKKEGFDDDVHWLMTASSDGVTHCGVPLAVPSELFAPVLATIQQNGAVCADVTGTLAFVPDPVSRLFDRAAMVPRLLLRITRIEEVDPTRIALETSVAVSFASNFESRPSVYATYVTFRPDVPGSFQEAVAWMKNEYVEGSVYRGKILTDFDQTRPVFPEASLALSRVMDRQVSRGELREALELMHVSASIDAYFDETAKQSLAATARAQGRKNVFISYAHRAERNTEWVARLRDYLEGLHVSAGIDVDVWDDTKLEAGGEWEADIRAAIKQARVAILVLTPEFLASSFIQNTELPLIFEAAQSDGATVLCVYGNDLELLGTAERLTRYQFVNGMDRPLSRLSAPDRDAVFAGIVRLVAKIFGVGRAGADGS